MRRVALAVALCLASVAGGPSGLEAQPATPADCPGADGAGIGISRLGANGPNLLLNANFPDPFVARFGGTFYAYATGGQAYGDRSNVQFVRSQNLTRWSTSAEVFPEAGLPAWVDRDHPQIWAPEVAFIAGRYILYFNGRHEVLTRTETPPEGARVLQRHCLGAAVADSPEGPFAGIDTPLVCSEFANGVIDANLFRDGPDGNLYLYFKDDGNCCGAGSAIHAQGLSADGLAAVGPPVRLLANNDSPEPDDDWEWRVVEAPTMVRRGNAYFLFYSGNFFGNKNYAVAYLSCASPRGPCRDSGDNPILRSHAGSPLIGPGHQSVLELGGRTMMFYHGWNSDPDGREQAGIHKRCLYVGRVGWERDLQDRERPRVVNGTPAQE
ncbi:MAG: glycoside hydrolase family 43 protein [Allosphingosinicella sp.]